MNLIPVTDMSSNELTVVAVSNYTVSEWSTNLRAAAVCSRDLEINPHDLETRR